MKNSILSLVVLASLFCTNTTMGQEKQENQEKEVSFDKKYIKDNDQKVTVEINELQELVYVILSITENGKKNPNMVNQKTEYYTEISKYFSPYENHDVVQKFNSLLGENLINYFILAGNAYGFKFDKDKIVPTGVYNFPAKGVGKFEVKTNPILTYISDLEDFAKKSDYRKFYKNHGSYYNKLKTEYMNYAAIDAQKQWLENKFDYKINSYRVLTSPLIGGMNATHMFEDNSFREILLFLPTIKNDKDWSEKFKKAVNTRIIFTEIDHNYVGPVSKRNLERLNTVFADREKWVNTGNKSTAHYPNPLKVFDEYLTWGLFILYAHDKFSDDKEVFNQIVESVNNMMVDKKGFPKAKEFNEQLLSLYTSTQNKSIEALYDPLLEWSAKQ